MRRAAPTGKPTVVGYTINDIDTWAGLMARSIRAAGGNAADMSTMPMATGSSPAASVSTMARNGWVRR